MKFQLINGVKPSAKAQKFWNMVSKDDEDSAEITLYGDVCSEHPKDWWTGEKIDGMYITPEGFMEDLAAIEGKSNITIKLNSCGGDLYTGIAIHNAIKGLKGHKTVLVEGIAASAASVIACAGDTVQVYPGSMIMIHGVAGLFYDYMTIADLKLAVKQFDASERAIAEIYAAKTGLDVDTLRNMMTKETWMVGQEAVDKGFADELIPAKDSAGELSLSADRKVLLAAGVRHDVQAFKNIPASIPVKEQEPNAEPVAAGNINLIEEVNPIMTEKELREQYPDIVASIENAAAATARSEGEAAERERMREIDNIAPQIGNALVTEAKYGEHPCNAAQLALKAIQEQAAAGSAFLSHLANDNQASGVSNVVGQPGKQDESQVELANAVSAYKSMKGGNR